MTDLTQVFLKGTRYILQRESDLVGDSGPILVSIPPASRYDDKSTYLNGAITVGHCIRCGSSIARSYQWQDYWQTTPVIRILLYDKDLNMVKFVTKSGSVYTVVGIQ